MSANNSAFWFSLKLKLPVTLLSSRPGIRPTNEPVSNAQNGAPSLVTGEILLVRVSFRNMLMSPHLLSSASGLP